MGRARLKSIDLYSGVGGWSLGLRMAGIDVVAAYDCWDQANLTYERNLGLRPTEANLREFPPIELRTDVDFVVGSPPCTRFSLSNRGGNGDIKDGLQDIRAFLQAVRHVSPRYWVMENVPRVAAILEDQLAPKGALHEFRDMVDTITVVDMSDFGLPQRRRRMLAGSFPLKKLESFKAKEHPPTLGEVIEALRLDPVVDRVFGFEIPASELWGNNREHPLDSEEERLNSQAKQAHRVYNRMPFPDPKDRTARTVTAVCTRVSRESIVVEDPGYGLRRLTLRERATLQGFPVTFRFYGTGLTTQQKLIGNAVPPLFAYYVGQCLRGISPKRPELPRRITSLIQNPSDAPATFSQRPRSYPKSRRFRSVIPNLGFGSGVRFELENRFAGDSVSWRVLFYFGVPSDIRVLRLDARLLNRAQGVKGNHNGWNRAINRAVRSIEMATRGVSSQSLQDVWNRTAPGTHPFALLDRLGEAAVALHSSIPRSLNGSFSSFVSRELARHSGRDGPRPVTKLTENAARIYCGMIVGSWFNSLSLT